MGIARADVYAEGQRIQVRTRSRKDEFDEMLAACKRVGGGRYENNNGDKYWHYPLSVDTCHALRRAFGDQLQITTGLADWYRAAAKEAASQRSLGAATDSTLVRVDPQFAAWLRGYQRAGAQWIARGYRGCGLVADTPGVGKTPETLAALVEADIRGPVLVVCPKPSVRLVWGREMADHLPDVPQYLAYGTRARRQKVIAQFMADVADDPDRLRVLVVVAEMLRLEVGDPCYTESGNKVSGMCKGGTAHAKHTVVPVERKQDKVPVGFSYPELFDKVELWGGWAAVILDESHKLLGSLTVAKGNLMGRGLKMIPQRTNDRRYCLSGTPFGKGGRVQGMFGTLHWLWPDEYTSFWKWANEWFEIQETVINRSGKTVRKILGLKGGDDGRTLRGQQNEQQAMEDFLRTLGPRILRRTKAEVMPELPPKTWIEVPCAMTTAQAKQYKQLIADAEVVTPGGIIMANGALALLTRERQIANGQIVQTPSGKPTYTGISGKLDQLWEALETRGILDGAPGAKMVVGSEFTEFTDVIASRLRADGVPFFHLDGSTTDTRRVAFVDAWQNNTALPRPMAANLGWEGDERPRVFLINTVAAGISINLDAADEMHLLDERWNPEENEQVEDRIHRASRVHKVFIYYYRTEGTIDYDKAHSVEAKRRAQHAVLDGSRGMEYVREMMKESFLKCEVED